ncbi:otoancorin [Conger conger]|uniref:otoancorin n=1 Tax=Conger conger TaxID=82655 RepID=UPI002A5A3D54|nr:otoancorin [Conger conger]
MACMIARIQNFSDNGLRCFMKAFMAPFSWMALMADESEMDSRDFRRLLWAARPFIRNMLSPGLRLPAKISPLHLADMANMFSEEFGSLTPEHRNQIRKWIKEQIRKTMNCSEPTKPKTNSSPINYRGPPFCRNWLNAEGMQMMGSFLPLLPADEFRNIPKKELCAFFWKPQFKDLSDGKVPKNLGRMLIKKLEGCFNRSSEFFEKLGRLGGLACFFDKSKELNSSQSTALLSQIQKCENSESRKLKKKLVMNALSQGQGSLSPELLESLGSEASVVPVNMLSQVKRSDIKKILTSMSEVVWKQSQARVLAKKLLQENVSASDLLDMGNLVIGVNVKVLRKVEFQQLETGNLEKLCKRLNKLQMAAVVDELRSKLNESQLVSTMPASQRNKLSLTTLTRARLSSLDQLTGTNWTRSQSVVVLKMVMRGSLRADDIKKMKSAVQGVTCRMINDTNQSDVLGVSQALTGSTQWLSRTQANCAAEKLYSTLEKQRKGYFSDITDTELDAIPTALLIYMPVTAISGLPDAVCSRFLDKMSQANLSTLPLSSFARSTLTNRSLACLGENMSDLSSDNITRLGTLVCELGPSHLSSLAADAQNTTLSALAKCDQINGSHSGAIINLLKERYGEPSDWSSSTMESFGRVLLLDDSEIRSLTYKSWLKETLLDIVDSLPTGLSKTAPKEFRIGPDLSTVLKKLFDLITYSAPASPESRRKRAACENAPESSEIVDLEQANVHWSADELNCISAEVFNSSVQILGEVVGYGPEQLVALKNKVDEVWGTPDSLTEDQVSQLGCVTQGYNNEQLKQLKITSLDTLNMLSMCSWTQEQREAMWQGYVDRNSQTVEALGTVEMVALDQFICGLSLNELQNLATDAFREAVAEVGSVECPLSSTEVLKDKAVLVFGSPDSWTEAEVNSMGNIIAGLTESELQNLMESVMPFISQTAIPLIPPNRLAALSVSQLQAFSPDNAAMVTTAQRESLSQDQRDALDQTLGVRIFRTQTSTQSPPVLTQGGASRVGIVGTLVFLQQFLFLTLCYAA